MTVNEMKPINSQQTVIETPAWLAVRVVCRFCGSTKLEILGSNYVRCHKCQKDQVWIEQIETQMSAAGLKNNHRVIVKYIRDTWPN